MSKQALESEMGGEDREIALSMGSEPDVPVAGLQPVSEMCRPKRRASLTPSSQITLASHELGLEVISGFGVFMTQLEWHRLWNSGSVRRFLSWSPTHGQTLLVKSIRQVNTIAPTSTVVG